MLDGEIPYSYTACGAGSAVAHGVRQDDQEKYHGAIQREVGRVVRAILSPSLTIATPARQDVVFRGRHAAQAKRAMLRYWSQHDTGCNLAEFQSRCTLRDDGAIVFR